MSDPQVPQATPTPSAPIPTSPATSETIGTGLNAVTFENPAPVTPEPVAATPSTPEPYAVHELENGQFEVKMDSGQIFKGTQKEVLSEMAKSVYHGTRTIAELKGKQPPPPINPASQPSEIDPTAVALADLAAQGFGFKDSSELKEFMSVIPKFQENLQQQQLNDVAARFLANTPDFPNSPENGDKIDATLAAFGLQPTVETLQMVHNHLKATGQYVKVPVQAGKQGNAMPMPPNGQSADAGGFDPWTVPLDQLAQTIRRS